MLVSIGRSLKVAPILQALSSAKLRGNWNGRYDMRAQSRRCRLRRQCALLCVRTARCTAAALGHVRLLGLSIATSNLHLATLLLRLQGAAVLLIQGCQWHVVRP
jgi:hypothetical protein